MNMRRSTDKINNYKNNFEKLKGSVNTALENALTEEQEIKNREFETKSAEMKISKLRSDKADFVNKYGDGKYWDLR